jgi:uncharacterized spore protein YtfJ
MDREQELENLDEGESGELESGELIERLADKVGLSAHADMVFAAPIEHDGTTVVPVAKVRFGFGAGRGLDPRNRAGVGGGGGVNVTPVGYIRMRRGGVSYHRIRTIPPIARLFLGAAWAAVMATLVVGLRARLVAHSH